MTVKEAKFALSVCPPDDDTNPDVPGLSEAQIIAGRNPQMKAWWEREKSFDRGFSRKLNSVNPPEDLAATIMRGGATIFFASQLIEESMGATPEGDSPLPEVAAAEPILPKSVYLRPVAQPAPKESRKAANWLWMVAIVAIGLVAIASLFLLFWVLTGLNRQ
jgi:hypothetical protein